MELRGGVWAPGGTLGAIIRGWAVFRAVAPPEGGSVDLRSKREGAGHLGGCSGEVEVGVGRAVSAPADRGARSSEGGRGLGSPQGGGPAARVECECELCLPGGGQQTLTLWRILF